MDIFNQLKDAIKAKAADFGFLSAGIANIIITAETREQYKKWLNAGYHGEMNYLQNNQILRFNPSQLHQETLSVISVQVPYLYDTLDYHQKRLIKLDQPYISAYALGRDYHKVVKQKLKQYAEWINQLLAHHNLNHQYRVFSDSAPILEVELAATTKLGWRGKNTLLVNRNYGSMFFIGEIFTNLPLEPDLPTTSHCGSCERCIDKCPTQAIIAPTIIDARRCISYLTIENKGIIPVEFRRLIGNRIYGCDDCQLYCPWNKFSIKSTDYDFKPRNNLDNIGLLELFNWSEAEFISKMQGSAIYRIGYQSWQRNLAIGLGNAPYSSLIIATLEDKQNHSSQLVAEHICWAINEQTTKKII